MTTPLVSLLINNYNYGRFLGEAIDSALAQTGVATELIVVDDGSTDHSPAVLAGYGSHLQPVLKANGGQGSAFNTGIARCRGEWVCLLDADDRWLPGKVAAVAAAVRQHPDAVLIYHRVQNVDARGQRRGLPWPRPLCLGDISGRTVHSGGWWPFPPTTALAFRRTFLEMVLPIPEAAFRTCADAYLADLAPFFGPVVGLAPALSQYRLHGSNLWHSSAQTASEAMLRAGLRRYETRVSQLNLALARCGRDVRVRLEDHLPYQRLRYRLGECERRTITHLAWRDPWVTPVGRALGLSRLWLAMPLASRRKEAVA